MADNNIVYIHKCIYLFLTQIALYAFIQYLRDKDTYAGPHSFGINILIRLNIAVKLLNIPLCMSVCEWERESAILGHCVNKPH